MPIPLLELLHEAFLVARKQACHTHGIRYMQPEKHAVLDIKPLYVEGLEFHYVDKIDEVIDFIFQEN